MLMRRKKVKTVLYLYKEQVVALKSLAARLDEPVSKLIREGVDVILKKTPEPMVDI
jgi:Ribbon-helix-helix domain